MIFQISIATFHNRILISGPFEHFWFLAHTYLLTRKIARAPKIKSAQMGLKLKFCYKYAYIFVNKILIWAQLCLAKKWLYLVNDQISCLDRPPSRAHCSQEKWPTLIFLVGNERSYHNLKLHFGSTWALT